MEIECVVISINIIYKVKKLEPTYQPRGRLTSKRFAYIKYV